MFYNILQTCSNKRINLRPSLWTLCFWVVFNCDPSLPAIPSQRRGRWLPYAKQTPNYERRRRISAPIQLLGPEDAIRSWPTDGDDVAKKTKDTQGENPVHPAW